MKAIHINCDLGEGGDLDAQLMPLISACNIACGGHAGDEDSMLKTVRLAMENQVQIGAHPSYFDRKNFGRKSLEISPADLKKSIRDQVLNLMRITKSEAGKITHIKPHGALYNDAAKDEKIAKTIIETILEIDPKLRLYSPPNSVISELAIGKIEVVFEAFADRNYNSDFSLVSRSKNKAIITTKEDVLKHVLSMFLDSKIVCENGVEISCLADTFCLHSDTPNAVEILQFLRREFLNRNIQIQ